MSKDDHFYISLYKEIGVQYNCIKAKLWFILSCIRRFKIFLFEIYFFIMPVTFLICFLLHCGIGTCWYWFAWKKIYRDINKYKRCHSLLCTLKNNMKGCSKERKIVIFLLNVSGSWLNILRNHQITPTPWIRINQSTTCKCRVYLLSHIDSNHCDEEAEDDKNEDSGGKNFFQAGAPAQQARGFHPVPGAGKVREYNYTRYPIHGVIISTIILNT